jgi:hypothetical protein
VPESRRVLSQIYNDIKYRPACAADQLDLGMRLCLIVQTPECAAPLVEGNVALSKGCIQAVVSELIPAPGARKEAPFVRQGLNINHENSGDLRGREKHVTPPPVWGWE